MNRTFLSLCATVLVLSAGAHGAGIKGVVLDGRTEEPIGGATVILTSSVDQTADSVTTRDDGSFGFADVAVGSYILAATASGYEPGAETINVRPNDEVLMRTIALTPTLIEGGGAIGGTVTDAETEEPLEGVTLVLSVRSGWGGSAILEPVDTATSDAEGGYLFEGVPGGRVRYILTATMEGYLAASQTEIRVAEQDTTVVDLALTPVGDRVGTISGTIGDAETEEPVAGATVVLSLRTVFSREAVPVDTAETAADGAYIFEGVIAQEGYMVTASAEGYEPRSAGQIAVVAGEVTTVDIALVATIPPTSVIAGTVLDDGDSSAIEGATVVLSAGSRDVTGTTEWTPVDTMRTAADGSFEFTGLEASSAGNPYALVISAAGYNSRTIGGLHVAEADTTRVSATLVPIVTGNMHVFVASETDETPVEGAKVSAALEQSSGEVYSGVTNADGWVDLIGVIAGNYTITVSATGYLTETQSRRVDEDEEDSATVLLAESGNADSRTLSGVVTDADGNTVAGAEITLKAGTSNNILSLVESSDADGVYEIAGIPLQYTEGSVTVRADGYEEFTVNVQLDQDTVTLDIELTASQVSVVRGIAKSGALQVRVGGSELRFRNVGRDARAVIHTLNGRRILVKQLPSGHSVLRMPELFGSQRGVLTVQQRGRIVWRGVVSH